MSGFVQFCINHVINGPNALSSYVLKLAFDNPVSGTGYPAWADIENDSNYSIEQGIREKVIYNMVGPLLNVGGGTTELLNLSAAKIRYVGAGHLHVNVPDSLTGGREILSIINIYPADLSSTLMAGNNGQSSCGNGLIGSELNKLINGISSNNIISGFTDTTRTGRNSFLIRSPGITLYNLIAKVILSYDDNFSIINPKAYPYLAELVVLGTQAYIYKNCRRGLKEAVQKYGYSLDDIQDEIDEYRDSGKEFMTMYETEVKKILAYSDPMGVSSHIAMVTPRRVG